MSASTRPVKWKRNLGARAASFPHPSESTAAVSRLRLRGCLLHDGVFVLVDGGTATLFDRVCLGRLQRGLPSRGVALAGPSPGCFLTPGGGENGGAKRPRSGGRGGGGASAAPSAAVVRFSLLEASFLAHILGCLEVFVPADKARQRASK